MFDLLFCMNCLDDNNDEEDDDDNAEDDEEDGENDGKSIFSYFKF